MSTPIKHQIITDGTGNPEFAVLPYKQFLELVEQVHDDENSLTIPHAVVAANIDGASMIKAWREYLGLTQQELADRLQITQPAMAKLERPDARPRRNTLKKIAVAMEIELAQLL